MERIVLKRIKPKEVYVSVLRARRVTNDEGWTRMEPVKKEPAASGSVVIDAVAKALARDSGVETKELAAAMGLKPALLNAIFTALTGMGVREFVKRYRLMQAREWMTRTDLPLNEVARRSGFPMKSSLTHAFTKRFGQTPSAYRRRFRPANFRELYEWDD